MCVLARREAKPTPLTHSHTRTQTSRDNKTEISSASTVRLMQCLSPTAATQQGWCMCVALPCCGAAAGEAHMQEGTSIDAPGHNRSTILLTSRLTLLAPLYCPNVSLLPIRPTPTRVLPCVGVGLTSLPSPSGDGSAPSMGTPLTGCSHKARSQQPHSRMRSTNTKASHTMHPVSHCTLLPDRLSGRSSASRLSGHLRCMPVGDWLVITACIDLGLLARLVGLFV
mmetsp:Transcript_10347/g.25021  ORF Transcript_10347/g.25021 Transcript_10347/m.25021 type:complete len:225 (-) Transcript_10347:630-1304(-)